MFSFVAEIMFLLFKINQLISFNFLGISYYMLERKLEKIFKSLKLINLTLCIWHYIINVDESLQTFLYWVESYKTRKVYLEQCNRAEQQLWKSE